MDRPDNGFGGPQPERSVCWPQNHRSAENDGNLWEQPVPIMHLIAEMSETKEKKHVASMMMGR